MRCADAMATACFFSTSGSDFRTALLWKFPILETLRPPESAGGRSTPRRARRWSPPKIERSWRNQSKNWTSPSENEIEDLSQDRGGYRIFWRGPNNSSILQASA